MVSWKDALSGTQIQVAELFVLTLSDGTISRYTSHDEDITFQGNLYTSIPMERTPLSKDVDVSTGETTITVPRHDDYITTADLMEGYFDNSTLQIYFIDRTNHLNYKTTFLGDAAEVNWNYTTVEATFKNQLNLFNKRIPPRDYTESCAHKMYDKGCKLVLADHEETGTAGAGSDASVIVDAGRAEADKFFDLGYIEMTSGSNNGLKRIVGIYTVGNIEAMSPFPNSTLGQTYKVYPHCKKTYASCDTDYGNTDNYGGFQNIPDPSEALL